MRDPDAGCFLFSDMNAILTRSTLSDILKYAQRTLAKYKQFLCAGRAGFPEILQIFRANFAQILRWESSETDPAKAWDFDDNKS